MKRLVILSLACAACVAYGTVRTNTVKNGVSDWTLPVSYMDDSFVPGAGDVVIVPDDAIVTVSSADAASFSLVSNLSAVLVGPASGEIVFDVAEDDDVLIGCNILPVSNMYKGRITKKGKGRLTAGDGKTYPLGSDWNFYRVPLRVEDGTWRCAQGINPSGDTETAKRSVYCSSVEVCSNGTFCLANGNMLFTAVRGLWGDGLVTTTDGAKGQFRIIEKACTFGGTFDTGIYYFSSARVNLTGTNSVSAYVPTVFGANLSYATNTGYTAVMKFGMKDQPSSIGTHSDLGADARGGGWGYLGEGETTDKKFQWYPNVYGPSLLLDAGAHGGLVLTGAISAKTYGMASIVLTGSNTASACEMKGYMQVFKGQPFRGFGANSASNFPVHITKTGTGIWKFCHSRERSLIGAVCIEEGTLGVETLDEAGVDCSLGPATNLFPRMYVAQSWTIPEDRRIDYAIELGGDKSTAICGHDSEGTFELAASTTNSLFCTTRTFAMTGDGRIRNATATNSMVIAGVRSLSAKAKTLTICGNDSRTNTLADVVDTAGGAISIVKDGTDAWILAGTNDIRGDVTVKAGTLILHNINSQPYSWYKWVIRSNWSSVLDPYNPSPSLPKGYQWDRRYAIKLSEFGLFDANGDRVNAGLSNRGDYPDIQPGEAAFATFHARYGTVSQSDKLYKWFNGITDNSAANYFYNNPGTSGAQALVEDDPYTWRVIMMRLADGAESAASWDYANVHGSSSSPEKQCYNVRSSTLYGSADGTEWELLSIADNISYPVTDYSWVFDGRESTVGHTNCNSIARQVQNVYPFMEHVGTVSVARDAVVEGRGAPVVLSRIRLDAAAGAGTFRNIEFAQSGTLVFENVPRGSTVSFERLFDGCPSAANLVSWTKHVNGAESRRSVGVRDGSLVLRTRGLYIIAR